MHGFILIGLLLAINPVLLCTVPSFSNLTVQSNFNLHQFLGVWYEIEWYKNETGLNSDIWNDYLQSFQLENNSNERLVVNGYARLTSKDECFTFGPWLIIANHSAKMILEKTNIDSPVNLNWPYYILDTDYNHYALIYGCMSENYTLNTPCKQPMLWVFSRTVLLSNEYLIKLDDYIQEILCLNLTQLQITLHTAKSCYHLSSLGRKTLFIDENFVLILLILYLFLAYK
jgi:lipocalin